MHAGLHARAVLATCSTYITEYGHGHCTHTHGPAAAFCVINGDECRSVVVPLIAQKQDIDCC